jgi:hypothetical protein
MSISVEGRAYMKAHALQDLGRGHLAFALLLMTQFQLWDAVISHVFVNSGLVREANPFVAPLMGGGSFLLIKLAGAVASLFLLWCLSRLFPRAAIGAACSVTVFYLAIVVWNFCVFYSNIT